MPTNTASRPASDKQLAFIDNLMQEKLTEDQRRVTYKQLSDGITGQQASKWIDKLLSMPTINVTAGNAMTDKQRSFAMKLAGERLEGEALDHMMARLDDTTVGITKKDASGIIDTLMAMDKLAKAVKPVNLPDLPAGRYAIENADGVLAFYVIRVKRNGQVNIFVKASHNEHLVPFSEAGYTTIMQSILDAGPRECTIRYGQELGHCGVCGRELTDEESRAKGIGPICEGRF